MNDQDRNLVEQVVKAAGKAGEQGFEYLVSFTFVTGIADLFGYAAFIAVAIFLGKKLYEWKTRDDGALVARAAGMIACAVLVLLSIAGETQSIAKIFAPAGAAIHDVVRH
jgi:FtsH-binding integral membrane protein